MSIGTKLINFRPRHPKRFYSIFAALIVVFSAVALSGADADVVRDLNKGFADGTVMSDSVNWFGPYKIVYNGNAIYGFCVDHKNDIAPDDVWQWQEVSITKNYYGAALSAEAQHEIAWAVGTFQDSGSNALDIRENNAAVELVEQDFMGSQYGPGAGTPMHVENLTPTNVTGFEGNATNIIAKAKSIKSFAIAHKDLVSSTDKSQVYLLDVSAPAVGAGQTGVVSAHLHDWQGRPVTNVKLGIKLSGASLVGTAAPAPKVTNPDGMVSWTYTNGTGDHDSSFTVTNYGQSRLPISDPMGFVATGFAQDPPPHAPQRIVSARYGIATGTKSFHTIGNRQITVQKNGDNEAYTPVGGATFRVDDATTHKQVGGLLTSDSSGHTGIATVPAGKYTVTEVTPPKNYTLPAVTTSPVYDLSAPQGVKVVTFNDNVIPGKIAIEKEDSVTDKKIADAHFKIWYDSDNNGSFETEIRKDVVTVSDQDLIVDKGDDGNPLKPGKYQVTETAAPPHYTGKAQQTVVVTSGGTVMFYAKNTPNGSMEVKKVDSITGQQIAGAHLSVSYDADGDGKYETPIKDFVSGTSSEVIPDLKAGKYQVQETLAPPGYHGLDTQIATVDNGAMATVTLKNSPNGNLEIKKIDSVTGKQIGNANLSVYFDANGDGKFADSELVTSFTTKDDQSKTINNLIPGKYEVKETKSPDGYSGLDVQVGTVESAKTATITLKNTPNGKLEIKKIDSISGKQIGGAKIGVFYDANNDGKYETHIKDFTTSSGKSYTISNLKPGKYQVKELAHPDHYANLDVQPGEVKPGTTETVTLKNTPLATVKFIKVPQGAYNKDFFTLNGAEFTVTDKTSGDVVGTCTTKQTTFDGDPAGVCSLPQDVLKVGSQYCWNETKTPIGWNTADGDCFSADKAAQVVNVEVKEVSNYVSIVGKKIDANNGNAVDGATFELYREGTDPKVPAPTAPKDAPKVANGTWVGKSTSDKDGKLDWGLQLPLFKYCAIERTAPAGYVIDKTPQCTNGAIAKGSPITITIKDTPFAHVLLHKEDVTSKAALANAQFDLYRKLGVNETAKASDETPVDAKAIDGYVWVARGTSDASGNIDLGSYAPGSIFCAMEHAAPAGYQLDETLHCTPTNLAVTNITLTVDDTLLPVVLATTITPPQPVQAQGTTLARTGGEWIRITFSGLTMLLIGRGLLTVARRRRIIYDRP